MKAPKGVAEDLVFHALGLSSIAFDLDTGTRRGEDIKTVCRADLMDAEKVGSVADHNDTMKRIGTGDGGEAANSLVGAGALDFGDDVSLGYVGDDQVLLTDLPLGKLVSAVTTQGDNEGSNTAVV